MQSIDDWSDLRIFAAVVAGGSLVAGAAALGVNHSTAFRRVRRLEERLGCRLLERRGREHVPTEVGQDVYEVAAGIGAEITALERRVEGADAELRGEVRFSTVHEIMPLLRPHLRRFRERFEGITLHARVASRWVDLSGREADVAIRAGGVGDDPDLVGRRAGRVRFAAYAAPSFGGRRPTGPEDLAGVPWVAFDAARAHLHTSQWLARHAPDATVVFRSDTIAGQLEGTLAGLGVGLLPRFAAAAHPTLERLFDVEVDAHLWLVWHSDLRRTARVRAFTTFMHGALAEALGD